MSSRTEHSVSAGTAQETAAGRFPDPFTVERLLWALVLLTMVLDVITTEIGLQRGLAEGNPVMAGLIGQAGLAGLVIAKLATLAVGASARVCLPQHRLAIPLGLATPGVVVVLINTTLLLGT